MRKRMFLLSFLGVAVAGYVFAESRLPRGLVGFSTGSAEGSTGVLEMTRLCQQSFPASRVCSSAEVLTTQTLPVLEGTAWVLPSFVPVSVTGSATVFVQGDASGRLIIGAECPALLMTATGTFLTPTCSLPAKVACCAGQPELLGDIDGNGRLDLSDVALLRRYLAGELSALPG